MGVGSLCPPRSCSVIRRRISAESSFNASISGEVTIGMAVRLDSPTRHPATLVVSQSHKPRMSEVILGSPFDILDLADQGWLEPSTLFLLLGESLASPSDFLF